MIKVRGISDFGTWLRKGKITIVNNQLCNMVVKEGYAKFIGYVDSFDKRTIGRKEMNKRLRILEKYKIKQKKNYSLLDVIKILETIK